LDTRDIDSEPDDLYKEVREQVLDLPSSLQLEYPNRNNNYKRAIQTVYKSIANHVNDLNHRISVVLNDSQALTSAARSLEYYWTQRVRYEDIRLPPKFLKILPGDLISLPVRNSQKIIQVNKVNRTANLVIEVEGVSFDADIGSLTLVSPTIDDYNPPIVLPFAGSPEAIVLDAPILADTDFEFGVYGSVINDPNSSGWNGGNIYGAPTGGSFVNLVGVPKEATIGKLLQELKKGDPFVVDRVSKLQVEIEQQELESIPDFGFYDFRQLAYVNGEIIGFQNAVLIAPDTYELSNLVRGARGTEVKITTHAIGSDFYLLKGNYGFEDINGTFNQLNTTFEFKAVPSGTIPSSILFETQLTTEGNRVKPYAPVNPSITLKPNQDLLIKWFRRSRKNGAWADGIEEVPLNEGSEAYDIEFFDGLTLVSAIQDHPLPYYLLSTSEQINLFGNTINSLSFKVYQKSIYVGRGHPMEVNNLEISRINYHP
jgi:hypothetical protein